MVYPFLGVYGRALGVELSDLALILSMRGLLVGSVMPFLGILADRVERKAGMLIGIFVFLAGSILPIIWSSYALFFAALCIMYLGSFVFALNKYAYLGDQVPIQRRGFVVGVIETSWALSFIVGVPLVGLLIERGGWQAPFVLFFGLGLLLLPVFFWVIPSKPKEEPDRGSMDICTGLREVLRSRLVWLVLVISFMTGMGLEIVTLVFGVWLEDGFGLKIAALGIAASIIGFSELGGSLYFGWIADRIGKIKSMVLGMIISSAVAVVLPGMAGHLGGALLGLFLFYLTAEFSMVGLPILASEVMPKARATMLGIGISAYALGATSGAYMSPFIYSWGGYRWNTMAYVALTIVAILLLRSLLAGLNARGE